MVNKRNPPGRSLAGPSRLPCAGWEDQQTLTRRLWRSLLPGDVMAVTECRIARFRSGLGKGAAAPAARG